MLCLFIHVRECTKIFPKSLLSAWIQHLGKQSSTEARLAFSCFPVTALDSAINWFLVQYLQHHRTIQSKILQRNNHEIFCLNSLVATISHTIHRSILMHTVTADFIHTLWTQKASSVFNFQLEQTLENFSFSTDHRRSLKLLCSKVSLGKGINLVCN